MNLRPDDQQATVLLDVKELELPATLYARDVVTGEEFLVSDGKFQVSVLGEQPRVLLVAPQPIGPISEPNLSPESEGM